MPACEMVMTILSVKTIDVTSVCVPLMSPDADLEGAGKGAGNALTFGREAVVGAAILLPPVMLHCWGTDD